MMLRRAWSRVDVELGVAGCVRVLVNRLSVFLDSSLHYSISSATGFEFFVRNTAWKWIMMMMHHALMHMNRAKLDIDASISGKRKPERACVCVRAQIKLQRLRA